MSLEEALGIVVNEAEISALGESTDEHLVILKACEIVRDFLNKKLDIYPKVCHYTIITKIKN